MKVVWTEQAWARLTEIEAFVARDHPEAAVRLVDKLIARATRWVGILIGVASSRKSRVAAFASSSSAATGSCTDACPTRSKC
jgi:hypothetical protein